MYIVKHQSVINEYMQKAGEPEIDAGVPQSDNKFCSACSQLNYNYSYPSTPRVVVTVFRLH